MSKPEIHFWSPCHPEAMDRTALPGEVGYTFRFPTDDGRELVINVGQPGFDSVSQMVLDMLAETPSYSDGSTNAGVSSGYDENEFDVADYLYAEEVCGHFGENLAILFQMEGDKMSEKELRQHVADRKALIRVRKLLIEQAERIAGLQPPQSDG